MNRTEVVQSFIDGRALRSYLEIGIRTGSTFLRVRARRKIAVDPAPRVGWLKRIRWGVRNRSNWASRIYRLTSDDFFASQGASLAALGLGCAFVDGLHTYQQSRRDVENCLECLRPDGVVLVHDCSPPSASAALPASSLEEARAASGASWDGMWCGDVFRTILYLRSQRPDLRVCVVDCDRGIGVVERQPASAVLDLAEEEIARLEYTELAAHREEWLDLRPTSELHELVTGQPA